MTESVTFQSTPAQTFLWRSARICMIQISLNQTLNSPHHKTFYTPRKKTYIDPVIAESTILTQTTEQGS